MSRIIIYALLLSAVSAYAFVRGRSDERYAAAVCLIASIVSVALLGPAKGRYTGIELGVLIVDLLALVAFVWIALRSDRFWPLWISGLQLTTSFGHLLKAADSTLIPFAYGTALRSWSYPILIILAIGTWRGHRRRRASAPLAA